MRVAGDCVQAFGQSFPECVDQGSQSPPVVLFGSLDDVVVEDLPGYGAIGGSARSLADVQKSKCYPAHVVGVRVLKHLIPRGGVGSRGCSRRRT